MEAMLNILPNDEMLFFYKFKWFADNNSKWQNLSVIEYKTLCKKEKMLVISIFSFFNNGFKNSLSDGLLKLGDMQIIQIFT